MTTIKNFAEFKNELPPVYKTWLDWYFDLKRKSIQDGSQLLPDAVAVYEYMPLLHEFDTSTVHCYHSHIGFIQAQIFREIEELIDAIDFNTLSFYHDAASRTAMFSERLPAIENIIEYLKEYAWRNKQITEHSKNK